jgi:ribosomal protein S15P/S13E
MNLTQQKLESLLTQLNMAQSKHPVSKMQVAMLKARIAELRAQIEAEHVPVEPEEVYSPHTVVIGCAV